jgi:hypothetical protein
MTKRLSAFLNACLATFVIAAAGNSLTSTNAFAEPLNSTPQRTVQVRLVQVETNADLIDSPMADAKISIQAGGAHFEQQTNKNGVAMFDAVPCGGQIVITTYNENEQKVFHRSLVCRAGTINLGVITYSGGGNPVLEQRRTAYYAYDPTTGFWRDKNGRIVPNRVIRRIIRQRGIAAHAVKH